MVDYKQSKLYRIICNSTNNYYIGKTCNGNLNQVLQMCEEYYSQYKNNNKTFKPEIMSMFPILENDNYSMELVKNVPCECIEELNGLRYKYINEIEDDKCVNKEFMQEKPPKNKKEKYLQYRIKNREYFRQKKRENNNKNKDKIKKTSKKHYLKNKSIISQKQKQYYKDNREIIIKRIKDYCPKNKDYSAKNKDYYNRNREKILQKHKERYDQKKKKNVEPMSEHDKKNEVQ